MRATAPPLPVVVELDLVEFTDRRGLSLLVRQVNDTTVKVFQLRVQCDPDTGETRNVWRTDLMTKASMCALCEQVLMLSLSLAAENFCGFPAVPDRRLS